MQQQTPGPNVAHSNRGFPSQLFAMLEQVEEDGMSHIVSWRPHGRAFKVHRKAQFVENVLPLYVPPDTTKADESFLTLGLRV